MKYLIFIISILAFSIKSFYPEISNSYRSDSDEGIIGDWVRMGPGGFMTLKFKKNGSAEVDFGNNGSIDVLSKYELAGDIVSFSDEDGAMCPVSGKYKILKNDYYIAFDLLKDNCGGRIKSTMGYWTRPEFKEFLSELDAKLSVSEEPELLLTRARIFLAVEDMANAQADLNKYLQQIDTNSRAYLNRASTYMPENPKVVIEDCNRTIELEPDNKNAFFLRGLARYELGEKEKACADFEKAIELGFSILRIAEQQKCEAFWGKQE